MLKVAHGLTCDTVLLLCYLEVLVSDHPTLFDTDDPVERPQSVSHVPPAVEPVPTPEQGSRARDAAMAAVEQNTDPEWATVAEQVLRDLAASGEPFITDWLWPVLEQAGVVCHDNRALGPIVRRLATQGVIRKTGVYLPSTRRHMTPVPQWVGTGSGSGHTDG